MKLPPYILFEKYTYILAFDAATPGNQHYLKKYFSHTDCLKIHRTDLCQIFRRSRTTHADGQCKMGISVPWRQLYRRTFDPYLRRQLAAKCERRRRQRLERRCPIHTAQNSFVASRRVGSGRVGSGGVNWGRTCPTAEPRKLFWSVAELSFK